MEFRIVYLPPFRAASSGLDPECDFSPEGRLGKFNAYFSAIRPEPRDAFMPRDFLFYDEERGGMVWWYALAEGMDDGGNEIAEFDGGYYLTYVYRDGDEEANVCLVSGSASLSADATASVAGAQAISVTLFDSGVGEVTRTTSGRSTMRWDEAGVYLPMVIVADLSACADVVSGVVWVEEQGLPAGDVNVSLGHTSRSAGGAASVSDTTVSVQAFDCAGDFVSFV